MATPTLVSTDKNGNVLPGRSGLSSISGDGSLVTFTDLTGEDVGSPSYQVYLKNLTTGDLTAISVSGDQTQFSRISNDGSTIVFAAAPTSFDFVEGNFQIYKYDVATQTVSLVTHSTSNTVGDAGSVFFPSVSDNGGVVSFDSAADNLVTGVTYSSNGFSRLDQVFINTGGAIQLITKTATNTTFNDNSWNSYVSADGKFVAFESFASNIGLGAVGHEDEVYLYNVATKALSLVSKTQGANGKVANGDDNGAPELSADGRYVIFISAATNLVPGATSGKEQIYWKDTVTGQLKLASCSAAGVAGNGICGFNTPEGLNYPAISADGRFVTFASNSTNLVPGAGTNTSGSGNNVVYVKDMVTGAIDVASQLTVDSVDPSISADGGFVSFTNNSVGATSAGNPAEGQIYVAHNPLPGDVAVTFGGTLVEGTTNDTLTIKLAVPPTTSEHIDLTVTPGTEPGADIIGIPASVDLKPGQTKITIPFQILQDPLASSTQETFNVSASSPIGDATVSGAVKDFDSKPYAFVQSGGEFHYNSSTKKMNGSGEVELDLVTSGGTASLVTIDGATATYDDSQFVVSGTVVEDLTGDDLQLFKGSFALPYSGASTSTLTDDGPFAGKFDLGGLPITINSLTFESNQLLAGFNVAIPFTQGVINLATSTLGVNFGLAFDSSGPQLGVGGTITLPDSGPVDVFGIFTGSVSGVSASYAAATDTLKLQGTFQASKILGFSATATVDLSGANFVQYQNGKTDFVGSLKMTEDVAPNEPFAFKEIDLSANTILKTFSGEVQFVFPFGGQAPEGDVKLVGSWGTGPTVNEVDVGFSNFSIPIPETPDMVWTSAAVGVKNMFVDKAPITFNGSLGFAFGPQLNSQYIANVTFSGSGSTQQLTAGYDLTMVPFAFANSIGNFGLGDLSSFQSLFPLLKSTGTVTANFASGGFKDLTFDGSTSLLGGFITTSQKIQTDSALDFTAVGQASVDFSNSIFSHILNPALQKKVTANFAASYTNGGPLSGDYAEAWFTLPVFGNTVNLTVGAKATLDGDISLFYGQPTNVPQASLPAGTGLHAASTGPAATYLFLTADWTTSAGVEPQLTVTSGGSQIQETDFGNHGIEVVSGLVTAFTETVVIQNPGSAAWSLGLVDSSGLGTVTFTSATPSAAPSIASFSAGTVNSDGTLTVDYNLANAGSATISFFADRDGQNFDGVLLGTGTNLSDGSATTSVSLASLNGGFWHVYALINDGANIPQEVYASAGVLINAGGSGAQILTPLVVSGGQTLTISAGHASAGLEIRSGGAVKVLSGGTAIAATILSGGTETVSAGGTDSGVQAFSGGALRVFGTESGAAVGGTAVVQKGGSASDTIVYSGGVLIVSGHTEQTVVAGGGTEQVQSGGTDSDTGLNSGAVQVVFGTAIGTTVGAGAQAVVGKGGIANGATVSSGGVLELLAGATGKALSIGSGGVLEVGSGETLSGAGVSSGATLEVLSGGTAKSTTVFSGGTEIVSAHATETGADVNGGTLSVGSGGRTVGVSAAASGSEIVGSGGVASATVVLSGGNEIVSGGGTAVNTIISGGGTLLLGSGGLADPTRILSGGTEIVGAFATDKGAQISGGEQDVFGLASGTNVATGVQVVESGGTASATSVNGGGAQVVESGGSASGTVVKAGGTEILQSGALVSGLTVLAGGVLELAGGYTPAPKISAGVILALGAGEVLDNFIVSSGITLEALAGGTASGTTIRKGGIEKVVAGGSAVGTSVSGGGTETLSSGGVAAGAAVGSGGKEIVLAGGTDIGAAVGSGGTAVVSAGGIAIGLTVSAAGAAIVSSGGVAELLGGNAPTGLTLLSGATLEVGSGGVLPANFVVSKGIKVDVQSGGTFAGMAIHGGGTGITEAGAVVGSSTTTVSSGGVFEFIGVNVQSVGPNLNLNVLSGGTEEFGGGAVASGGTIGFGNGTTNTGVTAEVLSGGTAVGATVPSANLLEIFSGGLASGAVISSGGREIVFAGGLDIGATITSGGTEIVSAGGTSVATSAIGAGGMLETSSGGTAIVSGIVLNSGTLIASGPGSLVEIVSGAVVSGGAVKVGNGIVDVRSGGSASISFLSTGSGGLDIADTLGSTSAFTGVVSGFGGANHTNHVQFIDLVGVAFNSGQITSSYVPAGGSGTLTVSSGGQVVASIEFAGTYSAGNFHISSGIGGTVKITDPGVVRGGSVRFGNGQAFPQHGIDLPGIAFGAQTTLAYAENRSEIGGTLTLTDGRHATSIALLGNYMAGNFVTAADGHGGTLVMEAQTGPPLFSHPRA